MDVVEFRVLGDIEARSGTQLVGLGHARQQLVLVAMLVEANRTVSTDQLINRIWGAHPPRRSRETVYSYLSRIRRVFADFPDVAILRRPGGYSLAVDPMTVDLHQFRDLSARARADHDQQRALQHFEQAVGLWRSDAFTGLESEWVDALRDEVGRERFSVELDRNDLLLRCGRHSELLPELTTRTAAHPLDERLAGQLMLTLYRCGRQAEALRHFHAVRQNLVDELGVEPGRRLQQHYQDISPEPRSATASPHHNNQPRGCPTSFRPTSPDSLVGWPSSPSSTTFCRRHRPAPGSR
ncbi:MULTISPECIES: AfsR/SARP family transcriptional regulator [unclassified Pseudonocardia]|uniref:AfsR/SARP family transcriptional regulator n=1 Tax=unclassified Pseudonocardia TaxID=2619320 RepID=UPI000761F3A3|nr:MULTISPECIES: AfsR/SARP family transcriptional regulator [unclassified Pseudonocardia]